MFLLQINEKGAALTRVVETALSSIELEEEEAVPLVKVEAKPDIREDCILMMEDVPGEPDL